MWGVFLERNLEGVKVYFDRIKQLFFAFELIDNLK